MKKSKLQLKCQKWDQSPAVFSDQNNSFCRDFQETFKLVSKKPVQFLIILESEDYDCIRSQSKRPARGWRISALHANCIEGSVTCKISILQHRSEAIISRTGFYYPCVYIIKCKGMRGCISDHGAPGCLPRPGELDQGDRREPPNLTENGLLWVFESCYRGQAFY